MKNWLLVVIMIWLTVLSVGLAVTIKAVEQNTGKLELITNLDYRSIQKEIDFLKVRLTSLQKYTWGWMESIEKVLYPEDAWEEWMERLK